MDCRGDQKGTLTEWKLRFIEKVERITLPLLLRNLGQIKIDITFLRGLEERNREGIPLSDDGSS
jgi:hypothetical protein